MATTKKTPTKSSPKRASTSKKAPKKTTAKKTTVKKTAVKSRSATTAKKTTATRAKSKTTAKAKVATKAKANVRVRSVNNSLKKYILASTLLLAAGAVAVGVFGKMISTSVTGQYLAENKLVNETTLLAAETHLFPVNVTYLIIAGLVVSVLWRLALLTKLSKKYETQLEGRFTSLNWVELSWLGPFAFVVIGLLVGVRDLASLLLLAAIPAVTAVLGYLSDRYNMLQNATWLKTKIALDALLLPWIVVGLYVLFTYVYGFVELSIGTYALLAAGLVTYGLLAAVHKKRILEQGRFSDYIYGEKWVVSLHTLILAIVAALAFV